MIEDVKTGQIISTAAQPVTAREVRTLGKGWRFQRREIFKQSEVLKLVNPASPEHILGLIALKRVAQSHVEVTHLESNPRDVGRTKKYRGTAGNLLAHAALISNEIGGEGYLVMEVKTALLDHYRAASGRSATATESSSIPWLPRTSSTYSWIGPVHEEAARAR